MTRRERCALLAVLVLGAALRLFHADAELWFDEIVTVEQHVRRPVAEIVSRYEIANNHVMNSLLAHAAVAVAGESPFTVRLPAISFGIAGVWAMHFAARQLWSAETALLAALCLAVSYPHVFYTQNARGYSAAAFFTLLATAFAIRLLRRGVDRRDGAGYAAAVALGLYSLLLVGFVAAGHGVVLLAARRWRALAWLGVGAALGVALYLPMRSDLALYYASRSAETGHPLFSASFAEELAPVMPLLAPMATAAGLLLLRLGRRHPPVAALLAAPLVLNVVLPAARLHGVHPRSFIYSLPLAYLLLGEGIDWSRLRSRAASRTIVAIVVGASLAQLAGYYRLPKQPFRAALGYVAAHRRPAEGLLGIGMAGKAARFYDPSVPVVDSLEELHRRLDERGSPTWILVTFERDLRRSRPEVHDWLQGATVLEATFPGAVTDGAVQVRRSLPAGRPRS